MRSFRVSFFRVTRLVALFLACTLPSAAKEDPLKQIGKLLQTKLAETLGQQFIKYDKQAGRLEFSPTAIQLAGQLVQKNFETFEKVELKPEGNALNFNIKTKAGSMLSASVIPESLELSVDQMAIRGLLPGGLKITQSEDVRKSVSGFFDSLFGAPSQIAELLKSFSVEGNTFKLTRPLKASALGRTLRNQVLTNPGQAAPGQEPVSRLMAMKMENGWLKLDLGKTIGTKALLQFTIEQLTSRLQGK